MRAGIRPSGNSCPSGHVRGALPVTHVRTGAQVLTIEEALTAFRSIADSWTKAPQPVVVAMAEESANID